MHLKNIILRGFKTFADKTEINFEAPPEITAIVGPNGCGKSNIIDALRFVLGEQSIKELRGNTLEELIFAGTVSRKPLSLAEVTIQIDNSDHLLNTEYNEIVIKRRIFRSGESEFFINKVPCRLRDIRELFMDTGIGPGSYSIINQGQVDAILSSKPEERRLIFEEAAGIAKYKFRKRAAERKLIATEQNLLRINDLKHEIVTQQETLKNQAQKAREYKELKEKLKNLEIGLAKRQLESFLDKKNQFDQQITGLREKVGVLDQKYQAFENQRQEYRTQSSAIETEIENSRKAVENSQSELETIRRDLVLEAERELHLKERSKEIENEISKIIPCLEKLENQLQGKAEEKGHLTTAADEYRLIIKEKEEMLAKFDLQLKDFVKKIEEYKTPIFEKERFLSEEQNKLSDLVLNEKFARDEMRRDRENLTKLSTRLSETERELNHYGEELKTSEKNLENFKEEIKNFTKEKEASENILMELRSRRNSLKEALDKKTSQLDLLKAMQENLEGVDLGTREILKSGTAGVVGALFQLLEVPEKIQLAIEVSLGEALKHIVTENDEIAKSAIKFLKDNNLGRATFLPLNIINNLEIHELKPESVRSQAGFLGVGSKLVKAPEKIQKVINLVLGRTLLVENIENGISLLQALKGKIHDKLGIKIVTVQGEVLSSSGRISGGKAGQKGTYLLGREHEISNLPEEVRLLKEETANLFHKEEALETRINNLQIKVNNFAKQSQTLEINHKTWKYMADELQNKKNNLSEEIEILSHSLKNRKEEIENIVKNLEVQKQTVQNLSAECGTLEENAHKTRQEYEEAYKNRDEINQSFMDIKISAAQTSSKLAEIVEKIKLFENEKERLEQSLEGKKEEKNQTESKILETARRLTELKNNAPHLEERNKLLFQKIDECQQRLHKLKAEIEMAENKVGLETEEDRQLRDKLSREEINLARLEGEISNIEGRINEEYGLATSDILNSEIKIQNLSNSREEAENLKGYLRSLEPVNLLAIEEYEKSEERISFIQTQYEDLIKSRENLSSLILELDKKAKEIFLDTVNKIGEYFSEIFKTLFEGGEAKIILEEGTDVLEGGVEIIAKPQGKKWLSLSLLSGGERALTAIALLFALLKIKPSPFCLLDEVDAALDEINIIRFTKMLSNFSKNVQIILITHSKRTMEIASTMHGITMEEAGISKIVSVKLEKVKEVV